MKDWIQELNDMLIEGGFMMTVSEHCVSGLVGDLCACWRCNRVSADDEDPAAARIAAAARTAHYNGWNKSRLFIDTGAGDPPAESGSNPGSVMVVDPYRRKAEPAPRSDGSKIG